MNCKSCNGEARIINTRSPEDCKNIVIRARRCVKCSRRFKTIEVRCREEDFVEAFKHIAAKKKALT